jgi:hypothetical protein
MKLNELAPQELDPSTEADLEWDRILQEDIKSGRLDGVIAEVKREYEAGETSPL